MVAVSNGGWMIVTLAVAVQEFASVTNTEYVPAVKPLATAVNVLLLHLYVYGAVPPAGVTVALPSFPP